MSEAVYQITIDGQEVQLADFDNLGAAGGLADDRVLAEILRLAPFDGTNVYKAVLPFAQGILPGGTQPAATVAPSGNADGSVVVSPFRAIVGSRNAPGTSPSPNPAGNYQSSALANWHDVRSGIFIGSAAALTSSVSFAANSSGNPRWDLVYATVQPDANGPSVTRRIKAPSSGVITPMSVPEYLFTPVTVSVVTGTPGATPALPALPADTAGNYNVGLAYVRIVNGYSSTSTLVKQDVRAYGSSAAQRFAQAGGSQLRPASGNNDAAGSSTLGAGPANWPATTHVRPGAFLPPDLVGGVEIVAQVDLLSGSSSNWSHANGAVIDNSIDWRNRVTRVMFIASPSLALWSDDSSGIGAVVPLANVYLAPAACCQYTQGGNTKGADANMVAGASTVLSAYGTGSGQSNPEAGTIPTSILASGAQVGLYVLASDGVLRLFVSGTPAIKGVFYIWASAPLTNP